MQNLPVTVTAAPPATSAQAPVPTDNNSATQAAAEPFGSVLARQRANASAPQDGKQPASKQPASSAANDASATAAGNDPAIGLQVLTPDAASILPSDMPVALLPAVASTNSSATHEKNKQAPIPDGVSSLPGDMLAMLLPATATVAATVAAAAKGSAATSGKDVQEAMPEGGKKARSQPIATAVPGEARQSAGSKAVSGAAEVAGASAMLRAQGGAKPEAAVTGINTSKDNTFTAALEKLGKDGAKTVQLDSGAMKTHLQPIATTALDGLLQSGVAPIAASPNGPAQVVQAVINTPVTHDAWGNEFNQQITWMATQHEQTAELHLNPPNLGPLDVVLNVSGDQATALFTSPHAAVRDAVEQALPKLRDMLADNGITLGNAMVSDQSPRDQQAWQAGQQQNENGSASGKVGAAVGAGDIQSGATVLPGRRHQGMVDTFA